MLVENGQIIAIDSVTTDGVTISGDGVKKPLTATPYSGVDGIVVEDFKIGLDHEHDESKWKMYGEDERNLTPKKGGSSITLTMAGTITANDNVTAENNSIYVGENISAQTTDSVIVLNGATQKNFPYTAYTGGVYDSTSSYSNSANKKTIEIEDIIDSRTQSPFVKEVYGKPTKLSAISNSFVAGEGNELTYGQNLLVNGFDNTANKISRSNVVGFGNYLSAMNSINLMGFNNSACEIEYTNLFGTYNTIGGSYSGCSFINVYGHKNYVGNTNSINIYGQYNSAYQTINTIVNGVSNMLYSVGNSNVQGHYNYVNYTTGVNIVGTFIQSESDKFSIIRGMFISANGAANNIIFNNGFSYTITPTSQIPSNGITASINGESSKLYVHGSNNIIMKENAISSYYDQVIGVISIDQSAYACTTNTDIRNGHCLLNIGAGNYITNFAWISNIGARNRITYSQHVSMMGASNTAYNTQHIAIYGAGNYVNQSKSVIVMGDGTSASTIGWSFVNTYGGKLNGISFSNIIGGTYGGKLSANEIHKSNLILRENTSAQYISQTFGAIGGSASDIHKSFVNICCSNVLNSGITNSLVLGEDYNNCTLQNIRRSIVTTNYNLFNVYNSNVISDNGFINSAYFSNIITNNTPIYNVYHNILNVHGGNGTVQSSYYGLGIGCNNVIISAERFDIIGDYISARNMNAGRFGCGYDATSDEWISGTKYQNPKYLNTTGSTFIHGGNIYASAKHFGEEYEGEIVEKPNSTFLVANGTSAIDNLNLTAFGNNIGEIQDVSSTFLIAPEGDKVFSAVASTSAGYVEHTDVETTNSGKSIVNVEYLMGIIEGLEARIQELENSHVYTNITEDNIDTLTGEGIIYIDNN